MELSLRPNMRTLILLASLCLNLPAHATLYKCQDTDGRVTYTNLPCEQNGLKETKVVTPPPPPAEASPVRPVVSPESRPAGNQPSDHDRKNSGTTLQLIKSPEPRGNKCAQLNDAMGKVMDDMDAARRKGYTQKQEAEWNARLKKLQADKNKHGCF